MSLKDTVVRAAVAKWLADRLGDIRKDLARDAKDDMDRGDRKKAVLEDGTVIGSVTITDPKWAPKVTDMPALLEWVRENAPTEIEEPPPAERVRPAYVAALLARVAQVKVDGGRDENGDPIKMNAAVDPETGELVPGLAFDRPKSNATVTVSPEQAEAIQAALDDGRLTRTMQALTTRIEPKEIER